MSEEEKLQLENECLMKYSKAQMIQKYIDELEESSKLSELWCKSQEENRKYKEVIDKAIDLIEKSVTTDIGIDSNNNIIHYHQLTEDETGELLDILKEVE